MVFGKIDLFIVSACRTCRCRISLQTFNPAGKHDPIEMARRHAGGVSISKLRKSFECANVNSKQKCGPSSSSLRASWLSRSCLPIQSSAAIRRTHVSSAAFLSTHLSLQHTTLRILERVYPPLRRSAPMPRSRRPRSTGPIIL